MAVIKKEEELEKIRRSGRILAQTFAHLKSMVREEVSLLEIDHEAKKSIILLGGQPAFLNYKPEGAKRGFPNSICTSLNHVIVHGVPTNQKLVSGDILTLDLGVRYEGYCADAAITVGIGAITAESNSLISAVNEALSLAIHMVKPGNSLGDIGYHIKKTADKYKLHVVDGLTGHGIGLQVHEEPSVFNYGELGKGLTLIPGMVLAIEPMFSIGTPRIKQLEDESYATDDNSLSAHAEHTIIVTETGADVVTK